MEGAEDYQRRQVRFESSRKYRIELEPVIAGLGGGRGKILDIGCGPGVGTEILARLADRQVIGLDTAEGARKTWPELDPPFVGGAAARLPFRPGTFSAITFIHSLGHIRDLGRALASAVEVLEPGGRVVVATPNRRFVRWMAPLNRTRLVRHERDDTVLRFFDENGLKAAVADAGFEGVHCEAFGARPPLARFLPAAVAAGSAERLLCTGLKPAE